MQTAGVMLVISIIYPAVKSFDWFTELRVPNPDKKLKSDDEIWADPDEVDVEFAQHIAREMNVAGHEFDTGDRVLSADWRCANCDEENTKEFHSCWKCGDPHDSMKC